MFSSICHQDISIIRNSKASRFGEETGSLGRFRILTNFFNELTIWSKYLHVKALQVSYSNMTLWICADTGWATKLTVVGPFLAKFKLKNALTVENLDSEISSVGNKYFAFRRDGDVPRAVEFSVGVPVASEGEHRITVDIKDVDTMVVPVGDEDSVFRVYGDATGAFELTLASAFAAKLTDKLAIFGENLRKRQKSWGHQITSKSIPSYWKITGIPRII